MVISIYGGSGSGKTTLATALQQYFLNDGRGCYLLSGDDYPHRIPKRNDEEQLRVYKEAGEDGLRGYLGTKKEIDFARINEVLAAFHEGKDTITLRHLEREDGEISSEETDFSGISVLLLEWTHGGSDDLHGVDLSVFLESSPEETKERRIRRNRDENATSPFICRVVELEQEKLEVQRKNAGFSVIDYDLNEQLADREDLDQLKNMGINLKLDFILNHASAQSPQFRDLVEKKTSTVNMLGCHDGISLLDLKGLLPKEEIQSLIDRIVSRGGMVKNLHGQKNLYYQVNATYYSAFATLYVNFESGTYTILESR